MRNITFGRMNTPVGAAPHGLRRIKVRSVYSIPGGYARSKPTHRGALIEAETTVVGSERYRKQALAILDHQMAARRGGRSDEIRTSQERRMSLCAWEKMLPVGGR